MKRHALAHSPLVLVVFLACACKHGCPAGPDPASGTVVFGGCPSDAGDGGTACQRACTNLGSIEGCVLGQKTRGGIECVAVCADEWVPTGINIECMATALTCAAANQCNVR
jgi:hypothetical protein